MKLHVIWEFIYIIIQALKGHFVWGISLYVFLLPLAIMIIFLLISHKKSRGKEVLQN
ncbi:hypothetical protein [Bacillus toyonensis]|uniref:hypothetical protein n=1 Tax=Bacillus toyonensis TaxID=155322 RepID=UPI0015944784|nr:hypothetical protein [Bacillus toyonensis]